MSEDTMTAAGAPYDAATVGERYHRFVANGQDPAIIIDHDAIAEDIAGRIGCTRCHQRPADFVLNVFVDAGEDNACAAQHQTRRDNHDYPACLACNDWAQCETYLCRSCVDELAPGYAECCLAYHDAERGDDTEAFARLRGHLVPLLLALGHDEQFVTAGIAQKAYFLTGGFAGPTRDVG